MKDHSISVDQARYATSIVAKHLDTTTVTTITNIYNTTFSSEMIFTKTDTSTRYEQVENLTREYNIHYRVCIESLLNFLSTRVYSSFAVHKLALFQQNLVKYTFKDRYIY